MPEPELEPVCPPELELVPEPELEPLRAPELELPPDPELEVATAWRQGLVAGHGTGLLPGSWQQTETQWLPSTTTVAVLVSLVPSAMSVPGAGPPSFCVTPNHGSGPIVKAALAGLATRTAVLPASRAISIDAAVDAALPLIDTEHQPRKFITVSVAGVAEDALPSGGGEDVGDEAPHATAAAVKAAKAQTPARACRLIVSMRHLRGLGLSPRGDRSRMRAPRACCVPREPPALEGSEVRSVVSPQERQPQREPGPVGGRKQLIS